MLTNISSNSKHNRLPISVAVATLLALFSMSLLANQAAGQSDSRYKFDPIAEKYIAPRVPEGRTPTRDEKSKIASVAREIKADRKKAANMLRGRENLDVAFLEEFFTNFEFPRMTQSDDETLSNMGKLRAEFLKEFLSERVVGATRTTFIERVALPRIKAIADGNYHPSVRLNAVLLAGSINGVEPNRSTEPQISVPAIDYLLEAVSYTHLTLPTKA